MSLPPPVRPRMPLPLLAEGAPRQALPALYARWLAELGVPPMPDETFATCSDCAMCVSEGGGVPPGGFDPNAKCCTFVPTLPNFLAGAIIADPDPALEAGRLTLRRRIAEGWATPLVVGMPGDHRALFEASNAFGRSERLVCPHYVAESGGSCSIWPYRNSICTTWFCKHLRGETGRTIWMRIRDVLAQLESSAALECALIVDEREQIGLPWAELGDSAQASTSAARDAVTRALVPADARAHHRRVWGAWHDRVEEFYRQCASLVATFGAEDLLRIGGAQLGARLHATRDAVHAAADLGIPDAMRMGSFTTSYVSADEVRLVTYSPTDAVVVSKHVLAVLPYFDGTIPTSVALGRIREREGISLDADLLRKLIDHGLLRARS